MEKVKKLLTILFISIFLISFISAVPKIVPYVNDFANVLTPSQISNLNIRLDKIEQNTSWEIAIVTVQNTEGQDRLEYANKIGDENGVGKKDKDNGIVILYSLEDGGAIATGRYSESIFNDAKVGRIGRDSKHFFTQGNYYEGFNYIINELEKEINTPTKVITTNSNNNKLNLWILIFPFGIIFILWLMKQFKKDNSYNENYSKVAEKKKRVRRKNKKTGKYEWVYIPIVASSVSHSHSSSDDDSKSSSTGSSSFGGSSFSGGGFGGGGASF